MSLVDVTVAGPVLTITLADEDRRNALGAALVTQIFEAFDTAEADPTIRAVVVTNRGSTFCAGANLSDRSSEDSQSSDGGQVSNPFVELLDRIQRFPKPVVGRIAGHAVGGGMGLVAVTDISIGIDDAKFGFTEVRLGVAPAIISVVCLPKMRPADARETFLRGNRFSGTRAAELGILNHAVPRDQLDATVAEVLDDLTKGGPAALAACKEILSTVPLMEQAEAFEHMATVSNNLFLGDEAQAGMKAFLAREPAPWIAPDPLSTAD